MREFITALETDDGDDESFGKPIKAKIDGYEVEFSPPTSGQMAMLFAMSGAKFIEQVGTFINFFFSVLPPQAQPHFRARLFDEKDQFGPKAITDIVKSLMEEWSANPTDEEPTSPSSPPPTGSRSTGKRRSAASTH